MKKVMIVVGSVRKGRKAAKVLEAVQAELKNHPDLEVSVADLKEINLPFYDQDKSPSAPDFQYELPETAAWAKQVEAADGFIFLAPEYNHSVSAVLKNAIDWVYGGWNHKPVTFVSWGVENGVRAVEHLRQIVQWPLMKPQRDATYIPLIGGFDADGNVTDKASLDKLPRTIAQLEDALNS